MNSNTDGVCSSVPTRTYWRLTDREADPKHTRRKLGGLGLGLGLGTEVERSAYKSVSIEFYLDHTRCTLWQLADRHRLEAALLVFAQPASSHIAHLRQ